METILIVDDNTDIQLLLSDLLEDEGYKTLIAGDGKSAIEYVRKGKVDIMLLDVRMPGMDGIETLKRVKKINSDLTVIMVSASGGINDAVNAMKNGAYDYVTKPIINDDLLLTIRKGIQRINLNKEIADLKKRLYKKTGTELVIGESVAISQALKLVSVVASTNMSIIIQGSSGTGKEVFANMIHQKSTRSGKPFVAIDCGAIPKDLVESELFGHEKGAFTGADCRKIGRFEQANGGTLFLDELNNLPKEAQAKLLRAIEERHIQRVGGKSTIKVDVRIIVTSNVDLKQAVKEEKFRHDLFHRLNEFEILLPELRERGNDIHILAKEFLKDANIELRKDVEGFTTSALKVLLSYSWPGNVRELKNVVKRAVLLNESKLILPESLSIKPDDDDDGSVLNYNLQNNLDLNEIVDSLEKNLITKAIEKASGNKSKAASYLSLNRKSLYRKMKKLDLLQ